MISDADREPLPVATPVNGAWSISGSDSLPTPAELGLTEEQIRRYQRLATLSEEDLLRVLGEEQRHDKRPTDDLEPQFGQAAIRRGPRKSTRDLTTVIVDKLDTFAGSMSTRQIYYQCVSPGAVQYCQAGYDKVQRLVVNLRRDGTVPYDRVVDRGRAKHHRAGWDGAQAVVEAAAKQYRRNMWAEQDTVVMVACEKHALEGIFAEAVDPYGASLWIVHGFSSVSFEFEWATEIINHTRDGKHVVIAYFGDHDPSGMCLEQKTIEKLHSEHGARFEWVRAGLLEEDFERFNLVNVPVKPTDSRSKGYLRRFGNRAAELDALPPDELQRRITQAIEAHIDPDPWKRLRKVEELERESLAMVVGNWEKALAAVRGPA